MAVETHAKGVKRQRAKHVVQLIEHNRFNVGKVIIRAHELQQSDTRRFNSKTFLFP